MRARLILGLASAAVLLFADRVGAAEPASANRRRADGGMAFLPYRSTRTSPSAGPRPRPSRRRVATMRNSCGESTSTWAIGRIPTVHETVLFSLMISQ